MANEEKIVRQLEEEVKYCYLAQHKRSPKKDLLGIVTKTVKCLQHQKTYQIVVSISAEDYDRITSCKDFIHA